AQLSEHILGCHTFSVVVLQPLMLRNIADGSDRRPADFAPPLGDVVSHRKDLSALLIQEQVVVAEMWSTHVPVEVFGLDVQGKDVAQQLTKLAGDLDHSVATEVGRALEVSFLHDADSFRCVGIAYQGPIRKEDAKKKALPQK